jgi:hypothetical protein
MRTVLGAALTTSLLAVSACGSGSGQSCPWGCPAPSVYATVVVATTSAVGVNGVQAQLTGPVSGAMACQPPSLSAVICEWPHGVAVVAGTYSLQVTAPGYQPTLAQVEVATPPPGACGCSADSITPSTLSLTPADAGTD